MSILEFCLIGTVGVLCVFGTQLIGRIERLKNARDEYKRGMEEAIETSVKVLSMQQGLRDESDEYFEGLKTALAGYRLILAKIWGYPILENRNALDIVNYIEGCHERHRQDVESFSKVARALRALSDENERLKTSYDILVSQHDKLAAEFIQQHRELVSAQTPDGSLVEFPHQKTA